MNRKTRLILSLLAAAVMPAVIFFSSFYKRLTFPSFKSETVEISLETLRERYGIHEPQFSETCARTICHNIREIDYQPHRFTDYKNIGYLESIEYDYEGVHLYTELCVSELDIPGLLCAMNFSYHISCELKTSELSESKSCSPIRSVLQWLFPSQRMICITTA